LATFVDLVGSVDYCIKNFGQKDHAYKVSKLAEKGQNQEIFGKISLIINCPENE
jgi:hypothetical protein